MNQIPTLTTDRLILRAPAATDVDGFIQFYASDRAQYVGGPLAEDRAWRTFATEIGHWHLTGCGMWAVTEKGDDTCLGLVGGWHPIDWPEREVGWLLWETAQGRGIGFEAASAAVDHAFGVWGWDTVVSYIHPENSRSISLAEKLGAKHDPAAIYPRGADGLVYRHPKPEVAL